MTTPITQTVDDNIQAAAERLAMSERGREALRWMLEWITETGVLGLDQRNKEACATLLVAAWGSRPGTAREAMADALEGGAA